MTDAELNQKFDEIKKLIMDSNHWAFLNHCWIVRNQTKEEETLYIGDHNGIAEGVTNQMNLAHIFFSEQSAKKYADSMCYTAWKADFCLIIKSENDNVPSDQL
jgi:hypothetical protein